MKAFLLAAGAGTRLRPLTNMLPKCLLPVNGIPLLQIWLENCRRAGIEEVLINVHSHGDKVLEFVESHDLGPKVHIVTEPQLQGSAGTLAENSAFVAEEKEFFVLYGDVLTDIPLVEMLSAHRELQQQATIAVHRADDPTQCGVVIVDERDIVQSFVEKPELPESNWVFSGIMVAQPSVIGVVPDTRPVDIGFHLLPKLAGKMAAYRMKSFLLDIGTLQTYAAAQVLWPHQAKYSMSARV